MKSKSPSAFSDFIDILRQLKNVEALKILGYTLDKPTFKQSSINNTLAKLKLGDSLCQKPVATKYSLGMTSGKYESPILADQSSRYDNFTPVAIQTREQHQHYPQHSSPLKNISHDTLRTHEDINHSNVGGCSNYRKNPDFHQSQQQQDQQRLNHTHFDNLNLSSQSFSRFGSDDGHLASFLAKNRQQMLQKQASNESEESSSSSSSTAHQNKQQNYDQKQQPLVQTPDTKISSSAANLRVAGGQQQQQQTRFGNTRASIVKVPPERAAFIAKRIQDLSVSSNVESQQFCDDETSNESQQFVTANTTVATTTTTTTTTGSTTNTTGQSRLYECESIQTNDNNIVEFHPYEMMPTREIGGVINNASHCFPPMMGPESDSSSVESVISHIDPDHNVTSEIIKRPQLLTTMEVKPAAKLRYDKYDDYKMTAKMRGLCLIINNVDFEGGIFPTRRGSDFDAKRFDTIFQQLGFSVTVCRNLTADQMRETLIQFPKLCKKEHDAVFILIFSHGNETGIYGTDGLEIDTERDVISRFDNRNCKVMIGKPKVFVIQACRGSK